MASGQQLMESYIIKILLSIFIFAISSATFTFVFSQNWFKAYSVHREYALVEVLSRMDQDVKGPTLEATVDALYPGFNEHLQWKRSKTAIFFRNG
jgi:hypothetical protein